MPSVSELDMRYVNQNEDELRGDLEINKNKNKIYLDHDKMYTFTVYLAK